MSVDYYSYAVLGVELPVDKLYRTVVREHKEHKVTPGMKYCPVCGEQAFVEVKEALFDEDEQRVGGLDLIWSTDEEQAFVGLVAVEREICFKVDSLDGIKAWLREELEPFGLWDEDKFGLYAVQYCSY